MRILAALLTFLLCFSAAAENAASSRSAGRTYITHVTVIDTDTGKELNDRTVEISADRVIAVVRSASISVPKSARVVNGKGKYLIPGLWDMHVHTWDYEDTYPLYIANGVTGVREMFGPPNAHKFRGELSAKRSLAPHFYLASPIVDGHPKIWPDSVEVANAEEARAFVREQKTNGADFIKVYSRLSREAYFAISDESARVGIPFVGHVPTLITASEASEANQKSFEHLNGIFIACSEREQELQAKVNSTLSPRLRYRAIAEATRSYSPDKCERLFGLLKRNMNWQVPTLTVLRSFAMLNDSEFRNDNRVRYFKGKYLDWLTAKADSRVNDWTSEDFEHQREIYEFSRKLVGAMFRAGVPLLAGTDTGNPYCFPGFSLHDELALLVDSGLTPLAALQAATRNAALFMRATDRYGAISKGKVADLVVLDADPLQDIRNTKKISAVFLAGEEFDRAALDRMLDSGAAAAEAHRSLRSLRNSK